MKLSPTLLIFLSLLMLISLTSSSKVRGHRRRKRPRDRSSRNLVPQLLPNYTAPSLPPAHEVGCGQATLACMYRGGCGLALKMYMLECQDLVHGNTDKCSINCRHALTALISTKEGHRLMECSCEDTSCSIQKSRISPCREEVTWNIRPDTIVTCTAAHWICMADPLCSTALDYYNRFCGQMFRGDKCSKRCKNSLGILLRQKSSAKLATCYCDGTEDFDCQNIKDNTDRLCFGKVKVNVTEDIVTNQVDTGGGHGSGTGGRNWDLVLAIISLMMTCLVTDLGSSVRSILDGR